MKTSQCLVVILFHSVLASKEHVTLLFVGDISFSGLVRYYVEHNYHTYNDTFLEVAPFIRAADIAVGNLECVFANKNVLSHKSFYPRKMQIFLDSSPESASALRFAGFDAMSLANNHFNDFGEQGVHFSTRVLKEAGIKYFGVNYGKYNSPQEALIMEKNGIKIGFLGYWDMVTPYKNSSPQRVNFRAGSATYEDDVAKNDIKRLKKKVDIIVVFMHWGNEFMVKPFRYQRQITKHLMSLGVDLIIGAHPHVIQSYCLRGNKAAAYSLGNFLFPLPRLPGGNAPEVYGRLGMKPDKTQILSYEKFVLQGSEALRSTLLFRVNVTKVGVLNADYLPLHFVFDSTEKRFHPEPKRGARWIHVCGDGDRDCQQC